MSNTMTDSITPAISVVIPVCNEEDNVIPLAREIAAALQGTPFEILFIDDGSTDQTAAAVLVEAFVSQRAECGGVFGCASGAGAVDCDARW